DENGQTYQVPADTTYKQWRGNLTNDANASNAEAEALKTTTFSDAEAANAYFGQAPERSLRRTDREEYDRLTEEYKQSAYGQWQANLTGDQESAIGRYTGDDYSAINGVLRGEMTENQVQRWDASGGLTTMEKIDDITDAISKFQLKDNITVYRTCEEDVFRNLQKQIGSIFIDDGFTSTSVLDTPVASGNVKMVIDVPAGIGNGAWISPLSGSPDEYEFLLQRGTQYRIDSIQETDGDIQIHMTVVGNNPKSEIKYATKEEVIQQWKDKGIYDEESEKYL
ncbi:MAG: hypothetical protein LUD72_14590, partial [Bacteroidales bacterium]|nr:hypothetical protein [Bacteroidales bacterium]